MRVMKGKLEATISLNKSTCYFLKTGQCSLGVAVDFHLSPNTRLQPADLLYCPSLRRAMERRERLDPVSIYPCECGHAEVVSGQQRACIASQTGQELPSARRATRCGKPVKSVGPPRRLVRKTPAATGSSPLRR